MNSKRVDYRLADEKAAREFLSWKYPSPYDIYNALPEFYDEDLRYQTDPMNNIYGMYSQDNGIEKYHPVKLRVTIAQFNKRALRVWEKIGFKPVQVFKRINDEMKFVIMTRDA